MTIRLSFGTAGIRAPLGPGDNQMNVTAVRGITHALCSHLASGAADAPERGLCIAYDGRTDSVLFAREAVRVARAHGFRVRAFEEPTPTPVLAFATRHHGAAAGVMITASHNPPHENGVKIYLAGGAQVLAPHDREIANRLAQFEEAALPRGEHGAYERLGAAEIGAYVDAIAQLVAAPTAGVLPPFGYSALCGVGSAVTHVVCARADVRDLREVAAEAHPREDFGGLTSPNPEHASALAGLLALLADERLDLGFAHDPDADRLAVVVRDGSGALRPLSGDEVGALIGDFLLEQCADPTHALLVSTLVSGELLERIAESAGARFARTPTGFKWIAARARELERREGLRFLFGYEEAIGYAFGAMADDKDGIAALYVLLALARTLAGEGRTLWSRLESLFLEHGVFAGRQLTIALTSPERLPALLMQLRTGDPVRVLGAGAQRIDYANGPEAVELLVFQRPDRTRLCVRPSGTEPKLKLYLHTHAPVDDGDLAEAQQRAARKLDVLESSVRAFLAG